MSDTATVKCIIYWHHHTHSQTLPYVATSIRSGIKIHIGTIHKTSTNQMPGGLHFSLIARAAATGIEVFRREELGALQT